MPAIVLILTQEVTMFSISLTLYLFTFCCYYAEWRDLQYIKYLVFIQSLFAVSFLGIRLFSLHLPGFARDNSTKITMLLMLSFSLAFFTMSLLTVIVHALYVFKRKFKTVTIVAALAALMFASWKLLQVGGFTTAKGSTSLNVKWYLLLQCFAPGLVITNRVFLMVAYRFGVKRIRWHLVINIITLLTWCWLFVICLRNWSGDFLNQVFQFVLSVFYLVISCFPFVASRLLEKQQTK